MDAHIYDAGSGFPRKGAHVASYGNLYAVVSVDTTVYTGASGRYVRAELDPADLGDGYEDDEHPCSIVLLDPPPREDEDEDEDGDEDDYEDDAPRRREIKRLLGAIGTTGDAEYWDNCRTYGEYSPEVLRCLRYRARLQRAATDR